MLVATSRQASTLPATPFATTQPVRSRNSSNGSSGGSPIALQSTSALIALSRNVCAYSSRPISRSKPSMSKFSPQALPDTNDDREPSMALAQGQKNQHDYL